MTTRSLLAVHDWTFLLGPGFCAGIGNGLLLGYVLYRSGLVPRRMAMIGLVGGPLAFLAASLVVFDVYDQDASLQGLLTVPEIVWEASLALYVTFLGFRPMRDSAAADEPAATVAVPEQTAAPREGVPS